MRLGSNQQCRKAGDLQSPGVTNFPTHPKNEFVYRCLMSKSGTERIDYACYGHRVHTQTAWLARVSHRGNRTHINKTWRKRRDSNPRLPA